MHPQLWTIPFLGLPIYSYGFMVMMGFLAAIFVTSRRAKKENLSPEIILDLGIIVMISGIIGARLAYLIIFAGSFKTSWQIFNIFDGNLNTVGGIVGWFIPYIVFYLRKRRFFSRQGGVRMTERRTHPVLTFALLFVISIISAVIITRVVYLVMHYVDYDFSIFQVWKGGLVFYGGLISAIAVGIYYLYKRRLNVFQIGDIVAPAVVLGLALGRIGCFLNGCCFGKLAPSIKWAVQFPKITHPESGQIIGCPVFQHHLAQGLVNAEAMRSLPVHPTQLYSAFFALGLFIILSFIWARKKRKGVVLGYLVLFYALGRFIIEFLRGDSDKILLGLTASQMISVLAFLMAIGFLFYLLKKPKVIAKQN